MVNQLGWGDNCAIWPVLCPCTLNPNLLTYLHSQTSAVQIWMICMTLTFWPGNVNGAWHIVLSRVEFVPHMTRIGQIGMQPWSGHCQNIKRPTWLDLLTWKQCVTYRHLMSCVYALYQANRSNRHRTEYDDLLTWKWCMMHHPSMGFICASYEVNRSNS